MGSIFYTSTTEIPLPLNFIALIIASIIVFCAIVFGLTWGLIQKRKRRDKAYQPIENPIK